MNGKGDDDKYCSYCYQGKPVCAHCGRKIGFFAKWKMCISDILSDIFYNSSEIALVSVSIAGAVLLICAGISLLKYTGVI